MAPFFRLIPKWHAQKQKKVKKAEEGDGDHHEPKLLLNLPCKPMAVRSLSLPVSSIYLTHVHVLELFTSLDESLISKMFSSEIYHFSAVLVGPSSGIE